MISKSKKSQRTDSEQREQYEYARRRIRQKKNLMRHFIFFLAGSILFLILNGFLKIGETVLKNWYIWAILIWAFFLLIHFFNVVIFHGFMGKEWEDRQLEKLKARQAERLAELQQKVEKDLKISKTKPTYPKNKPINNPIPDKE